MKTILVLTDYSQKAEHAAKFAVKLARKIKANVLLCHAFMVPEHSPMMAGVAWQIEDYFSLKEEGNAILAELVAKLKRDVLPIEGRFYPKIKYTNELGELPDVVQGIKDYQDITFAVMGAHGISPTVRFFFGSNVRGVLDAGICPVLIVPEQAVYKDIANVAFATDLRKDNIDVLHSLSSLCDHFDAQISLVYVSGEKEMNKDKSECVQHFLNEVSSVISYPKLYYRNIKNTGIPAGLYWLSEHSPCDLLVIVHRKHSLWERLTKGSITKKLADKIKVPMLVFPDSTTSLPVF